MIPPETQRGLAKSEEIEIAGLAFAAGTTIYGAVLAEPIMFVAALLIFIAVLVLAAINRAPFNHDH